MSGARERLLQLYRAAIAGANVESLTADAVSTVPLDRRHRVWIFAVGKAAHGMAAAAVGTVQRALADIAGGVVVATEPGPAPCGTVTVMVGDHPVPGAGSGAAAARIQEIISRKRGTDVGIVLLSGGASSLIGAPLRGTSAQDLAGLFELLLASGLDIQRMNAVRKRFSYWAAGRMALGLAPAATWCFALSDVPGDDLAIIGSGPCVPDPTRARDVSEILTSAGLLNRISPSFKRYLVECAHGVVPETPKATHPAFAHMTARVIGSNRIALRAAAESARATGLSPLVIEEPLNGDAMAAGGRIAARLLAEGANGGGAARCLIWGGETTVTLPPQAPRGGRCQALALAAAQALGEAGGAAQGITLLAAGTDGRDGTTDAAGAIVDAGTSAAIAAAGHDPAAALQRREAHAALSAAQALIPMAATGTNVADVVIGLIQPA